MSDDYSIEKRSSITLIPSKNASARHLFHEKSLGSVINRTEAFYIQSIFVQILIPEIYTVHLEVLFDALLRIEKYLYGVLDLLL